MNIVSASALAGLAAFATVMAFPPEGGPPEPQAASEVNQGIFLKDRSVLLAAIAGTCETRTDVGESLLGGESTAAADDSNTSAAPPPDLATPVSPSEPAEQMAVSAPIAGTCGTRPPVEGIDAGVAMEQGSQKDLPVEQVAAEVSKIATLEPELEPGPAVAPKTEPKPAKVSKPNLKPLQPPKEPLTAWWPARKAEALNVLFVGEASFGSAISMLTDGQFESADSANAHIEVRSAGGAVVKNRWQLATNRQMLLLIVKPGVYTVSIQPELTDAKGRQTGVASSGPVYVR